MKMEQILISEIAHNSDDLYNVVYANSKIITFLLAQGQKVEEIHPVALASYYVDYYFSQVNSAGFSKFVHGSSWDRDMLDRIAYGLKEMKSMKHFAWFTTKRNELDKLDAEKLKTFVEGHYLHDDPFRAELDEDKSFYKINDDIVDLNGQWVKEHADVKVLSMDDIFLELERVLGKPITKD